MAARKFPCTARLMPAQNPLSLIFCRNYRKTEKFVICFFIKYHSFHILPASLTVSHRSDGTASSPGAIGVPVFAGFRGGPQVLVGPTGGYILGYLVAAFVTGFAVDKWGEKLWVIAGAMVVGLALCYTFGTLWYLILTGKGLVPALMGCVVPFLPGDAAKIIVATLLTKALRRYLR